MKTFITIAFWIAAILASSFYGKNAVDIFLKQKKYNKYYEDMVSAWHWHQRWLNGVGAFVGWLVLWLLLQRFCHLFNGGYNPNVRILDIASAIIAFAGITGYLPGVVIGVLFGIGQLGYRLAELLMKLTKIV